MIINHIIPALLIALLLTACTSNAQQKDLTATEFKTRVESADVQILDVRTQNEYNSGHLKNAFLADWTQPKVFEERIKSLDKTKPVYTYCLAGGRSSAAAEKLRKEGFTQVYNMQGGMMAWKNANLPVENKVAVPQITLEQYTASIPTDKTVLVDIGAVWCPPCKKMEPVIRELAADKQNNIQLININGGEQEQLAAALNAATFPTFIIYKNGKETWRHTGIIEKEVLAEKLK